MAAAWTGGDPGTGRGSGVRGGLPGARPDQQYRPTGPQGPVGSSSSIVRARRVIVSGPNEGMFSYSPSVGPGNLVGSTGIAVAGTDQYGNAYLAGTSEYEKINPSLWRGVNILGSVVLFIRASSPAGPWQAEGFVKSGDSFNTPAAVAVSQVTLQAGLAVPAPNGGGTIYTAANGTLHYVGPGGTDTQIAPS